MTMVYRPFIATPIAMTSLSALVSAIDLANSISPQPKIDSSETNSKPSPGIENGKLLFKVQDRDKEKQIQSLSGAKVTIEDNSGKPNSILTTGSDGEILSGELTAGHWLVIAESTGLASSAKVVEVIPGKTTLITFLLSKPIEKILVIRVSQLVAQTAGKSGITRGQNFIKKVSGSGGNGQSLSSILRTNPGLATDSGGQVHPVGEHASISYIVDGFQIPDSLMGHQGVPIIPSVLQSIDVMTGGFAPKYGRQTAAIIDVDLLNGGPKPILHFSQSAGSYSTFETSLLASGQIGKPYGLPIGKSLRNKSLSYLFTIDERSTKNALEPPQPGVQESHNGQTATYMFGHLEYRINNRSHIGLSLSSNPIETQIANRAGLPSYYIPYGQGYGFGGAQPASSGLLSQQQEGQNVYQTDYNEYGILSYGKTLKNKVALKVSFGITHNALNILNNNPLVNLANLPADNSIEFNPTFIRNQRDQQGSIDLSMPSGHHHFDIGMTEDHQTGIDSYQLIPASQAALNYLLSGDPTNSTPDPTNPLYNLAPIGLNPSNVGVTRVGNYRAAFAQDTWQVSKKFSFNYGLRWEQYIQNEQIVTNGGTPAPEKVTLSQLEPRLNLDYNLAPKYQLNASYNRLMIIPPSPAGLSVNPNSSVSPVAGPETVNQIQFGTTIEPAPRQSLTINYIYKQLTNQLDSGLLVPGTQIGAYASASIPGDTVRAFELGYNFAPPHNVGFDGYISYQNALAKIQQIPGNPYFGTFYNDHDQLHTLTLGTDYTFKNKASLGLVFTFGSGFASSSLGTQTTRHPHSQFDFDFKSPVRVSGQIWQLGVGVLNIFDKRNELNFLSGFDGTRFQQGRRLIFSLSGKL